jgi:hypothetical protein
MMDEIGKALPIIKLNTHQQSRFPRLIDMTVIYICLDQCGAQIELDIPTPSTATQIHGNIGQITPPAHALSYLLIIQILLDYS